MAKSKKGIMGFKPDLEKYEALKHDLKPILEDLGFAAVHLPQLLEGLGFATFFMLHKATADKLDPSDSLSNIQYALLAAVTDYFLLKSRSEIGVGLAIGHLGLSSLQTVLKKHFVKPDKQPVPGERWFEEFFKPQEPFGIGKGWG